jgi:membrane associated rhomboid family serine protease
MTANSEARTLKAAGYVTDGRRKFRIISALLLGTWAIWFFGVLLGYSRWDALLVGALVGALYASLVYRNLERRNLKARALANQAMGRTA